MVFVDEAHSLRSENKLLTAVQALRNLAGSIVLMTATPLHNAEKVFCSLFGSERVCLLIFTH